MTLRALIWTWMLMRTTAAWTMAAWRTMQTGDVADGWCRGWTMRADDRNTEDTADADGDDDAERQQREYDQ
jgi:hypothetical protein